MDVSPKSLRAKFICSKHFKPSDIINKKLSLKAVPIKYNITDETSSSEELQLLRTPNVNVYPSSSKKQTTLSGRKIIESDSSSVVLESSKENIPLEDVANMPKTAKRKREERSFANENKKLRLQLCATKKMLNSLKSQLWTAKKKLSKVSHLKTNLRDLKLLPLFSKYIVNMQLRHRKRTPWLPNEKKVSICMYYKSPSAYKFLRSKGVILPSVSIIKKWNGNFTCHTGINKNLFKLLKLKASTMTDMQRRCVMLFDEMSLKKHLDYNKKTDIIEGYQDLGSIGRKAIPAGQALVFMLRGVYSKWKIPIGYILTEKGIKSDNLQTILLDFLKAVEESGFRPIIVTCDQSRINQKVFRDLGVVNR